MSDEIEAIFRKLISELTQQFYDELDLETIDVDTTLSTDEPTFDFEALFFEPPQEYSLKNGRVISYLIDLLQPHTTDAQWQLGRDLADQLAAPLLRQYHPKGRPIKVLDRIFLCIHVEWCFETLNLDLTEAIQKTVVCLNASESQLKRWYTKGKGVASAERRAARLIIELVQQGQDFIKLQSFEERIFQDLMDEIEKFEETPPQ